MTTSVNGNYLLPSGQTSDFAAADAAFTLTDQPSPSAALMVAGAASVSSDQAGLAGVAVTDTGLVAGDFASVHVANGGTLSVRMTGAGSSATGYLSGTASTVAPSIINDGVIDIEGVQQAVGARLAGWAHFDDGTGPGAFTNNNLFEVIGDTAVGLTGPVLAGAPAGALVTQGIHNAGVFTVAGGASATGISIGYNSSLNTGPITNSGVMTVTASRGSAIGIHLTPSGFTTLANSGTITAQTAIQSDVGVDGVGNIGINNSGSINGDIVLHGSEDDIVNTGTINGAVRLGHGDTLDSHSGTITGAVTLADAGPLFGAYRTTVSLGAEDNTVLFGAGATHIVDGGGGVNTASYAAAGGAVNVSLAAPGQAQDTGVSTDTLANFQNLIGSGFNDTLTAAAAGASSLTGGAGADTFKDVSGSADVTITDFSHAQGDRIDLMALPQFHTLSDVLAAASQSGADTVINTGAGSLTLKNVRPADLTGGDFILAVAPGSGLKINVSYDASTANAPSGFFTAVQQAVQFFESTFGVQATVNINVGWGEVNGQAISSTAVAESMHAYNSLSFQAVQQDLAAADARSASASAGIANLGAGPGGGAIFEVATAEEKAWGLPNNTAVDGYVGLSSSAAFTFDPSHRAVAGAYDAIGAIEHEISEVLGRVADSGVSQRYTPLDLFSYSSPNVHSYGQGLPYFSLDGSELIKAFNTSSGADRGDWAASSVADSFDAFGQTGVQADVSSIDLSLLDALGYAVGAVPTATAASTPPPTATPSPTPTPTPPPPPSSPAPSTEPSSAPPSSSPPSSDPPSSGPSPGHPAHAHPALPFDFAHTGQDDLLFRNTSTGDWGYMSVSGSGQTWHPIGPSSPGYAALGVGDFNGDGVLDTAFRSTSSGDWGFLSVNPAGGETWHPMGPSSLAYSAIATGDFNGDGSADVLFRNPTTGDWGYMSANASGGQTWHGIGPSSPDYVFIGSGDFNGDGIMDAAFRQGSTGAWGFLSINPTGGETWHGAGPSSLAYDAIATGDFNGDGSTDILFRNSATGDWGYMSVNASGGQSWHGIGPSAPDYAFLSVGDFNGDGVMDAAFRQVSTGEWGFLSINPTGGETWHHVGSSSTAYMAV